MRNAINKDFFRGRGAEPFEDYEIDVLSGKRIDLGVLDYVPDIKNNPQAMEVITELVAKLPDMEIDGVMSEEMEARVWELRMPDLPPLSGTKERDEANKCDKGA